MWPISDFDVLETWKVAWLWKRPFVVLSGTKNKFTFFFTYFTYSYQEVRSWKNDFFLKLEHTLENKDRIETDVLSFIVQIFIKWHS